MSTVKFYRGLKSAYNAVKHKDGIYFAKDKGEILVNGTSYGLGSDTLDGLNNAIKARVQKVEFVSPDTIKVTDGLGNESIYNIPLSSTTSNGLMSAADKTKLDGIAEGAQVNVLEGVKVDGVDLIAVDKKVNIDLNTPLSSIRSDIDNLEATVEGL